MNPKQIAPPAPTMGLGDIYYILFRHKWLVIILSAVAVAVGVVLVVTAKEPYTSEAKLLVKYVKEAKPPEELQGETDVTSLTSANTIINSELNILTSFDLALQVADTMTPAKLLANMGGGTNRIAAAGAIRAGIQPVASAGSDVVVILFTYPDADLVGPILKEIIETYIARHKEIHRPEGADFMTREKEVIRGEQEETEKELHEMLRKLGVSSLEDSQRNNSQLTSKIQEEIYDAEAELASYKQTIADLQQRLPKVPTNSPVIGSDPVPAEKQLEYQKIASRLAGLQASEEELMTWTTTNNILVQTKQAEIANEEARKNALEKKYPALLGVRTAENRGGTVIPGPDPVVALNEQIMKSNALNAKVRALTNEMAQVLANSAVLSAQESTIRQLERKRDIEASDFAFYSRRLEEIQANDAAGTSSSNISILEEPTPAGRDLAKPRKIAAEVFGGILALAFGLPFLIELALDRSLKRPSDVQAKLKLPFFISIPYLNGLPKTGRLKGRKKAALLPEPAGATSEDSEAAGAGALATRANGQVAYWDERPNLRPFYETLRDRLMTYFEMINLTHKPKLVAVTSCGEGAGVTSTAAGLAAALSETGEGNVLLVNMNVSDGEAHHFYKGQLAQGLDEVLEKTTRGESTVRENLYVANEQSNNDKLPRILPKRFSHLLPKMKASDFDYIIFDMPPVSQISITPKVAKFMDMVLLVVESEKTDRDAASRAADMLAESKTNVGVVLNKNRSYVPRRLQHDL
jgi:uncharacterized protein involved in exopolysaccharide biosynthesis/Mrp family chromosome partitioning ATPase